MFAAPKSAKTSWRSSPWSRDGVDGGLHRVVVRRARDRVRAAPDRPHDLARVPLGEVAEEDPGAVLLERERVGRVRVVPVERVPEGLLPDRAEREVLAVVVDPVVDLVLDPRGAALHQPEVLLPVVGELDGVEELVRRGHAQGGDAVGPDLELLAREVVVDDAVRGDVAPGAPPRVVGRAVAVEAHRAEVGDVDVELPVRPVVARGEVRARLAVVERPDLGRPDLVERRLRLVDPVGEAVAVHVQERRRVARLLHPPEAHARVAGLERPRAVAHERVVRAVRPREQALREPPLRRRELRRSRRELAEDRGAAARVDRGDVAEEPPGPLGPDERQGALERVLRPGQLARLECAGDPVRGGGGRRAPLRRLGGAGGREDRDDGERHEEPQALAEGGLLHGEEGRTVRSADSW